MRFVGASAVTTPAEPWGPVSDWTIARNASNPVTSIPAGETTEQYDPSPVRIAAGNMWIYVKGGLSIYAWKSTDEGETFSIQNGGAAVLTAGAGSAWDHSYVLEPHVVYEASANTIHMFYKGYPGPSGNGISVGHATASDSAPQTWTKDATNPILEGQDVAVALGGHPVADLDISSVLLIGATWHFYGYIQYNGVYYLYQCTGPTMTSPDANTSNLIGRFTGDTVFETPSVIREPDGSYLMLYAYGGVQPAARYVASATSPDGSTWTAQTGTVLAPTGSGWEQLEAYSGQFVRSNVTPFSDPYIDGMDRSMYFYSGLDNASPKKALAGLAYITLTEAPAAPIQASAGNAAGVGTASNISAILKPNAGNAAGTGTAWAPTVTTDTSVFAFPANASGTGTANQPNTSISDKPSNSSGTGTAWNPTISTIVASTAVYGSGVAGDSRANQRIGGALSAKLSYRFTATASSAANTVRFQERGGSGYSLGTGGTMRCRIQTDSGGTPSGTTLATLTWTPGNPSGAWEVWTLHTFSSPATLSIGTVYHLVIDNTDADQVNNYISLNMLFTFDSAANPAFDSNFRSLYAQPTTWAVTASHLPIFDLAYASGAHDGQAYIGTLWDKYGNITGTTDMVRETFTVSGGSRTVTAAHVRLKRISGTGALVVRLETGAGALIEAVNVAAASIAIGTVPDGSPSSLAGDTWCTATFLSSHVLTNGSSYNLRLSTDASTRYTAVPVQEGGSKGLLSKRFTDGSGQRTTNSGSTWADLYLFDAVDLQFYFDT